MSSKKIKQQRDKLARKAIEGKISVPEAQRRAGGKYARAAAQADLVKMQRAQATRRDQADQLTGMVKEAFAKVLKSAPPLTGDDPRPESSPAEPPQWTGGDLELRNRADFHPDPRQREAACQALVNEGMLPGTRQEPVAKTARGSVWAPGPDGVFGWRPVPESRPLDFGMLPPRT